MPTKKNYFRERVLTALKAFKIEKFSAAIVEERTSISMERLEELDSNSGDPLSDNEAIMLANMIKVDPNVFRNEPDAPFPFAEYLDMKGDARLLETKDLLSIQEIVWMSGHESHLWRTEKWKESHPWETIDFHSSWLPQKENREALSVHATVWGHRDAEKLREACGIKREDTLVDLDLVCRRLGIHFYYRNLVTNDVHGVCFTYTTEEGKQEACIIVDNSDAIKYCCRRFHVALLLGLIFTRPTENLFTLSLKNRESKCKSDREFRWGDRYSQDFALAFLLPPAAVKDFYAKRCREGDILTGNFLESTRKFASEACICPYLFSHALYRDNLITKQSDREKFDEYMKEHKGMRSVENSFSPDIERRLKASEDDLAAFITKLLHRGVSGNYVRQYHWALKQQFPEYDWGMVADLIFVWSEDLGDVFEFFEVSNGDGIPQNNGNAWGEESDAFEHSGLESCLELLETRSV